jgi:hypothetical protein
VEIGSTQHRTTMRVRASGVSCRSSSRSAPRRGPLRARPAKCAPTGYAEGEGALLTRRCRSDRAQQSGSRWRTTPKGYLPPRIGSPGCSVLRGEAGHQRTGATAAPLDRSCAMPARRAASHRIGVRHENVEQARGRGSRVGTREEHSYERERSLVVESFTSTLAVARWR